MKRLIVALLATLVGCSAPPVAQMRSQHTGAARIDLVRALAHHPFAPVLAQYDADIDTLRRAAGNAAFKDLHGEIGGSALDIDRRLKTASARLRGMHSQTIQAVPAGSDTSHRDFSNGIVTSFQQASQSRVARAVDLRASQLHEHEATVAFDFERAHAGRRLVLGLKLRDLHLDAPTRRRYHGQLDALDRQEAALVGAERRRDDGILAAYATELRARAIADSASRASDLANHARAMQEIPRPQMRALPSSMLHPDGNRAATVAAFDTARRDLTARFADLQTMDDAANADLRTEISNLVRERDALRAQIVASIEARAAHIAVAEHLGRLYTTGAPDGARDVTDAVVRSYWVSTGS
jgi:hypothetical protein